MMLPLKRLPRRSLAPPALRLLQRQQLAMVLLELEREVDSVDVHHADAALADADREGERRGDVAVALVVAPDVVVGRALRNLPALRDIGFAANRRLLQVEALSHDCLIGEDALDALTQPVTVDQQRAAGLRFGDRRVQALMHALPLRARAQRLSSSRPP